MIKNKIPVWIYFIIIFFTGFIITNPAAEDTYIMLVFICFSIMTGFLFLIYLLCQIRNELKNK